MSCLSQQSEWECQNLVNGIVTVIYTANHWNHPKQLAHLPIPDTVKQQIAAKLQHSVSVQGMLVWISAGQQLGRQHVPSVCHFFHNAGRRHVCSGYHAIDQESCG